MSDGVIPLVDLRAQHRQIAAAVEEGFAAVLGAGDFVLGKAVVQFEREFARFAGVRHCIGVGNGTDALELALRAANVGPGDEVIVPANSFIATALAVARAGAVPVLADCDARYLLLDPEAVRARIGPRTRAVVPVHLYGQMAPMESIQAIAATRGIAVIEDAAQAHGATRHGVGVGAGGVASGTSFYPGKNLGAYGDGGAVLTDSDDVAARVRALRNYGSDVKYHHPELGFNSRLDSLQAVVLSAKLVHLASWNAARAAAAARYDALLAELRGVRLPETVPGNQHVWHLYVIRVPQRDRVVRALNEAGIGAGIHYPTPIHLHGAFRQLGHQPGDFPNSEAAAAEILSLPLFPEITVDAQKRVVTALRRAMK